MARAAAGSLASPAIPGARRGGRSPAGAAAGEGPLLSHPERVIWPEDGITKRELADYLRAAAARMLPHVANRPLSLLRAPQGIGGRTFFQRHPGPGLPAALRAARLPGMARPLLALDDAAGLVALAQLGAVEIHPWGASLAKPDAPDRLGLDLDPDEGAGFAMVVAAARALAGRLEALGLFAFCKATGGKGLHVVVPLRPRADWAEVKALARAVCEGAARDAPDRYTLSPRKAERGGRVFLDYLRNDAGSSAIAPWSPRARPRAPVAMPLGWDEVTEALAPGGFALRAARARLEGPDPWEGFAAAARPVTSAVLRRAGVS